MMLVYMQPHLLFNTLHSTSFAINVNFGYQSNLMIKVFTLLLLTPFFALAQDSTAINCKLINSTDPYTKETKLSTGFIYLKGASVTIDADSKEIDVLFSIEGIDKCFDNNSTAAIFFEGVKTKMTSRNGGTMNCEGLFHFIFRNTALTTTILQKMMTQKINHIVFTGNGKKESIVTVKPETQQQLMDQATCLVNEAKSLIK